MIRTVLGDIDSSTLGHSQCHEHLFVEKGASFEVSRVLYMDEADKSLKELEEYRENGGSLVVDAQPGLYGRMAEQLAEVSRKSGVHIVASTGFHKTEFCDFPDFFSDKDAEEICLFLMSEITQGMLSSKSAGLERTDYRAGIIKVALDSASDEFGIYPKLFEAAAEAQKKTGATVLCHTDQGCDALRVLRFFTDKGVPAEKVIICHLDRARRDVEYNSEIAAQGAYLDYDSVARLKYLSHEEEIRFIEQMISRGYSDRIMLSLDTTRARLKSYGGDIGLSYILTDFEKMLKEHGISDADIENMTVNNARRALAMDCL